MLAMQLDFSLFLCGVGLLSAAAFGAGLGRTERSASGGISWPLICLFAFFCALGKWAEFAVISAPCLQLAVLHYVFETLAYLSLLCFALFSLQGVHLRICVSLLPFLCLGLLDYGTPDFALRVGFGLPAAIVAGVLLLRYAAGISSRAERLAILSMMTGLLAWAFFDAFCASKSGRLPFGVRGHDFILAGFGVSSELCAAFAATLLALSLWLLKLLRAFAAGLPWRSMAVTQGCLLLLLLGVCGLGWRSSSVAGVAADNRARLALAGEAMLYAKTINFEHLRFLTGDEKDWASSHFLRINRQLACMAKTNPSWKWTYIVGIRGGRLYSLVDSLKQGDPDGSPSSYEADAPPKLRELVKTGTSGEIGPYTDRWGTWISAFSPIPDEDLGQRPDLFGVDVEASKWDSMIARERAFHILGAALICAMLLIGIAMTGRRIGRDCSGPFVIRYAETCHICLLCAIATAIATFAVWRNSTEGRDDAFSHLAIRKMEAFLDAMRDLRAGCLTMDRLVSANDSFDAAKFKIFAASVVKRLGPGQSFAFLRKSGAGDMQAVVECVEPLKGEEALPGSILSNDPRCLSAMELSLASGLRETAGPFNIASGSTGRHCKYIVFQPVISGGGWLLAIWRPQPFLAAAVSRAVSPGGDDGQLSLSLYECDALGQPAGKLASFPELILPDSKGKEFASLVRSLPMPFFGRSFQLRCEASASFLQRHATMAPWLVLASGLALTLALTVLAYIIQSGRRRAEELVMERTADLRKSQERFAQVSEQSREMIWELDREGLFSYVSKGSVEILGVPPEELVGLRRLQDFSSGGFYQTARDAFASQTQMRDFVCELVRMDGQHVWTSRNAIPTKAADGSFSGFRGSDYDISSAKKAEELSCQQAAFLQQMMDAIPNPVYYKDSKGLYLGCNKAFEEYMGLPREKVIGGTVFDITPREFAEKYHKMDMELVRDGGVQCYESVIRLSNGSLREALFNKAIFKGPDGNAAGFIGVIVDISERKKIETERMRNEAHLDSLLRLSQFHSKSLEDLLDFALEQALRLSSSACGLIFSRGEMDGKYVLNSLLAFDGVSISVPSKDISASKAVQEALSRVSTMSSPIMFAGRVSPDLPDRILAVPVSKGSGLADAVLIVAGKSSGYESSDSLQLSLLLESIWKIYERNLAEENVRQDLKSLGIILNILHMAMEDVPLKSVLNMALNGLCTMSWFNFTDKCSIQLCEGPDGKLEPVAFRGATVAGCGPCCLHVDVGECVCGGAALKKEMLFVRSDDPAHGNRCRIEGPHSHFSVPILYGQRAIGVLSLILDYKHQPKRNEENFLQALAGVLSVIIQRRKADEELIRAHEANKILISSIPSILMTIDKNGRVLQFNPAAERIFRKSAVDVVGRTLAECALPWDYETISSRLDAFRKAPCVSIPEEIHFTKVDGQDGCLRVIISPMAGSGAGSECGAEILIVANDVTERRSLESQLLQAQKLEAIGQLAAGIAHEINTPTQYIGDNLLFLQDSFKSLLGYINRIPVPGKDCLPPEISEILRKAAADFDMDFVKDEAPKALQQSIEGVGRISEIVHAMKEFSHPGSKGKTLVDINKSLSNTLTVARNEWKYVSDVKMDFAQLLPPVPCIPGEINQVFLNIIVNAAHAIGDRIGRSGGKGLITVSTALDGDLIEIRIKDTGGGIPDSIKSRIFEPFFTTKGVGKGTGQGLSIARGIIVKRHGGELFFESEQGVGTCFVIRLPVCEKAGSIESQEDVQT